MLAQTSTRVLAVIACVALQKLFLELPRWAQLNVLVVEVMVFGLAILLWRGEPCEEIAHPAEPQPVLLQPLVLLPMKGERNDVESDAETESTAGTDTAATETESDVDVDSDWPSSEDVESCNCFPHAAWQDVGTRLVAVFHLAASAPITSDDERLLIVARGTSGRTLSHIRDIAAFGFSGADSNHADDDHDDDRHDKEDIVFSGKITCSWSPYAQTPETETSVDPWVTIGRRLSAAFSEISASAFDDEEDPVQSAPGWTAVAGRVAGALRQIASGEPMQSDEDGFPIAGQDFFQCNA